MRLNEFQGLDFKKGFRLVMLVMATRVTDISYCFLFQIQVPNHHCLLGERITYNRRKQEAECYNGRHYERAISKHPCECIDEDYEW